jgi:acetylornithine deacetylase/succinyl-diaminopimelate desuccinylase-like protein
MTTPNKLAEWLSRIVQIPSVNPAQAGPRAGTPGEGRIAEAVATWFTEFGGEVQVEEVHPGRPNVYGIWRGRSDRWVAVDVHTDTVSVEQMVGDPFDGRIADGRVYGRGAVDTKASLGVILALLEAMHHSGATPEPNILIAATVDEENGAKSAPVFARWIRQQQIPLTELMVAEPTMCHPVYGHKGGVMFEFEVEGVASHSAKPHLGKNAIHAAAQAIVAIEKEHERLQTLPPKTDVGVPTLTVAMINGGTGRNVVPDTCRFSVGWRSVPGEKAGEIAAHMQALVERHCPLPVTMEILGHIDPFLQAPDSLWVRRLSAWSGQQAMTAPYGTNAWAYGDLPGECIVLGPGSIDQAHGDVEWVEISELEKLAGIYTHWWGVSL